MRGLRIVGDYALEFLVISLLVALSAVSIIFFIPMLVGVTAFFGSEMGTRRFKDIFTAIGANWKILIFYTLFQLVIILFPVLNIYFFSTHPEHISYFVLAVSCVALFVGVVFLATAPTVIVNMNVNFFQLLRNGIMMVFGSWWRTLVSIGIIAGIVALIIYYPYPIALTLYAAPLLNARLMKENFYHLKAKALGTSVYELKKKQKEDDYLDEKGQIKPLDENGETK
ncbi:MAG: hypothetical protein J1F68_00550 [Clostridiales bacterium]|nr:hypothetical protein [Clostridiales bacterium]